MKKIRSLKMSYAKQQTIFRTCRNYGKATPTVRGKIDRILSEVAEDAADRAALLSVLTSDKSIRRIALEHYLSETKLYALRRKFYERW